MTFFGFWIAFLAIICLPIHTFAEERIGSEVFPVFETKQQFEVEKQALRNEYAQLTAEQTNLRKAYLASTSEQERASLLSKIQTLNFRIQVYEGRIQALAVADKKGN